MATALQVCLFQSKVLLPLLDTLIFHAGKPAGTVRESGLSNIQYPMMGSILSYNSGVLNLQFCSPQAIFHRLSSRLPPLVPLLTQNRPLFREGAARFAFLLLAQYSAKNSFYSYMSINTFPCAIRFASEREHISSIMLVNPIVIYRYQTGISAPIDI